MPQIIPIRDLKKTSEISAMCKESKEPIFITKNGYGDMVIMSIETYEKKLSPLEKEGPNKAISDSQIKEDNPDG